MSLKPKQEDFNVLYIDDEQANLALFRRLFGHEVHLLTVANNVEARNILSKEEIHLLIIDQRMPEETGLDFIEAISDEYPLCAKVVLTAYADRQVMRKAFQTNKILDFILKPFEEEDMREVFRRAQDVYRERLQQAKINQNYENLVHDLGQDLGGHALEAREMIGSQGGLKPLIEKVSRISSHSPDSTVLILGESGTGKELIARALHAQSPRRNQPFIAVNCPAIAESLWESELFGHEKGAFSNAHKRKLGRFELADKGTLFLDEIGELPENLQVKLLRILQERTFERVGGTKTLKVDVRVITATNRSLEAEVRSGRFRQDLYYRLNVVPLVVPALRDRAQDVPDLLNHFLKISNKKTGKNCTIAPETLEALGRYAWPGNIRELENLVERAVVLSDHDTLGLEDLKVDFSIPPPLIDTCGQIAWEDFPEDGGQPLRSQIRSDEVEKYKNVLKQARGNISEAARLLGIHRRTLTDRLRKADLI